MMQTKRRQRIQLMPGLFISFNDDGTFLAFEGTRYKGGVQLESVFGADRVVGKAVMEWIETARSNDHQAALDAVLKEAVWAMEILKAIFVVDGDECQLRAQAFLDLPIVQDYMKRHKKEGR